MARLLIVEHSQTGGTAAMADAVAKGAADPQIGSTELRRVEALNASVDDVLWADGYILGTPENFGYMSGAIKHFLDTVYYPVGDRTKGRPYALFVKAGNDGTGAVTAVQRIVTGLGWKPAQSPVIVVGDLTANHLSAARDLGMAIAAGLELGLY